MKANEGPKQSLQADDGSERSDVPFNGVEERNSHQKDNSDRQNHSSKFAGTDGGIILLFKNQPESTSGNAGLISQQSNITYNNKRKNEQTTDFTMGNHN